MSHLIVDGIDTVYTPDTEAHRSTWHGLQTVVQAASIAADGSNVPNVFCPIVQCGLKPDYATEVCTVSEDLQDEMNLDDYKLIIADCTKGLSGKVHPLYVPKKGYVIHQNKALFSSMVQAASAVLGENGFEIATVGTLGGYSQFFISIALKGKEAFNVGTLKNGANDVFNQYFNLNSSHNGLIASNCMLSTVRVVCMNTVKMSISDAEMTGRLSVIKHTLNSEQLVTAATFETNLKAWVNQSEALRVQLVALKAQAMSAEKFQAFATGIFTNEGSDKLSTVSFNRVTELASLFARGKGNSGETAFDGLNAFTEFFTTGNGVGNKKNVSANKRVATANFGRGNDWKLEALRVISHEETLAETIARGEILLNDYNLASSAN